MQGEVSGDMKVECNESSDYCASVVQRFYRGYRTRRLLADSAVVVEELWWQAINYARLNHSTISFFNFSKPETIASRWIRIGLNASKVGKGLSKDAKGQKLAFQHWIEAIDPRHRYGHSLHLYYEEWCKAEADQPFFYWLDVGDGKDVDLLECPRSKLRQQCIKYFGPQEREHYEYVVAEGKIVQKHTGKFLDSNNGLPEAKWIFVMSTSKRLYAGEKKKGVFHHSTFLAGGATLAAGRLVVVNGILKDQYMQQIQLSCLVSLDHIPGGLKSISAYSGHYRTTDERLVSFLSFLKDNGVNLDEIEVHKSNEDYNHDNHIKPYENGNAAVVLEDSNSSLPDILNTEDTIRVHKKAEISQTEARNCCRKSLFGGLQSPKAKVAKTAILQRINSKKAAKSYQLGHQLSFKWSTGAGPRIGCIADYPAELRLQALEITSL